METRTLPNSRKFARRARGTLLWSLGIFAALQLLLALAMQRLLPEFRDPSYFYKAASLHKRIAAAGQPLTVIMLGSSRTSFGLKGGLLEDRATQQCGRPVVLFNFGIPGAGPVTELITLKRLLADGVKPNLLLVEVFPPSLAGPTPAEARWLSPLRMNRQELSLLERYDFPADQIRSLWRDALPVPWYAHRFAILSRVDPGLILPEQRDDWGRDTDRCGWTQLPIDDWEPEGYRRAVERIRKSYGKDCADFCRHGAACQALRELLEVCRAEGIPTMLVLMPEGEGFRSLYPPAVRQQLQAFVNDLSREYASPLIDAREWVPEQGFSDGHHLMARGAALFTERLGREAVLPFLAEGK